MTSDLELNLGPHSSPHPSTLWPRLSQSCLLCEYILRYNLSSLFQCLQSLGDLRLSPHFPHTAALDQAVGAAVASMGPEVVLEAVPLEIDGSE